MKMSDWIRDHYDAKKDWVVLTGASTGIGYEYLVLLCQLGCRVVAISNELEKMQEHQKTLAAKYGAVIEPIYCDLRNYDEVAILAQRLTSYSVSVLINNAGFGIKGRFEKHSPEVYRDIVAVNAVAPVVFTRAILPQMLKINSGIVIHIASINAYVPIPNNQIYTATKAFCLSYAMAVATENRKSNVVFQIVLPGTTLTPFHDKQGAHPAMGTMMPDEVAKGSFMNLHKAIFIPNKYDRLVPFLMRIFSLSFASRIAGFVLNKRLGVK